MWYFSWILGFLLACSFAVLNALWLEMHDAFKREQSEDLAQEQKPDVLP